MQGSKIKPIWWLYDLPNLQGINIYGNSLKQIYSGESDQILQLLLGTLHNVSRWLSFLTWEYPAREKAK